MFLQNIYTFKKYLIKLKSYLASKIKKNSFYLI